MFVLISISNEAFRRMMVLRLLQQQLDVSPSVARNAPEVLRRVRGSFGGKLVLVNWANREVLADRPLLGVSGLAVRGHTIVASSWIEPRLCIFESGEEVAAATHRWFNYVHSVDLPSSHSILVASAGSDLIAEITFEGELIWDWFGPEHGYSTRRDGLPAFCDRGADYRLIRTSTAEQAMHVNSALRLSDDTVLATLFHQGTVISIDRVSKESRVVLDGLTKPHGLHARDGGFILSDTLGHRIILLDNDLRARSEIPFGSHWLQDAIATSAGTYLTLENVHIDQLPEPHLCNRITEIDGKGQPLRTVELDVDFRLFTAREIDEAHAQALKRAWGKHGNFEAWRWG
jgi:hypothetical protein